MYSDGDNQHTEHHLKEIAFVLGCFILPKYVINGFDQTDKEFPIEFENMTLEK